MAELCPAFLAADFEEAAREAYAATERLSAVALKVSARTTADGLIEGEPVCDWLERQSEWRDAQSAVQRQFRARTALEQTGLPVPADAAAAAERAQSILAGLGASLGRHDERDFSGHD